MVDRTWARYDAIERWRACPPLSGWMIRCDSWGSWGSSGSYLSGKPSAHFSRRSSAQRLAHASRRGLIAQQLGNPVGQPLRDTVNAAGYLGRGKTLDTCVDWLVLVWFVTTRVFGLLAMGFLTPFLTARFWCSSSRCCSRNARNASDPSALQLRPGRRSGCVLSCDSAVPSRPSELAASCDDAARGKTKTRVRTDAEIEHAREMRRLRALSICNAHRKRCGRHRNRVTAASRRPLSSSR